MRTVHEFLITNYSRCANRQEASKLQKKKLRTRPTSVCHINKVTPTVPTDITETCYQSLNSDHYIQILGSLS